MDRTAFKVSFTESGVTKYHCPTCGKGVLQVKAGSFKKSETRDSVKAHQHEAWEPEWTEYIYSCLFECTNAA